MAWIELHQTLPSHRKIKKLKRLLKIKTPQAVGHVVMLWLWSVDNAPDGDLSPMDAEDIAEACEWSKDAKIFVDAMIEAGLIDADMKIHDWGDYTGQLMERREEKRRKDRERQARYRARKADEANADKGVSHAPVTRDKGVSHAPNSTVQYSTSYSNPPPRAREGPDCHTPEAPPTEAEETGQPPAPTDARTDPAFGKVMTFYMNRIQPTPSQTSITELHDFSREIEPDVVIRAMEYAIDEHKATWSYIRATLQAYKNRGIRTMADLQRANDERDRAKQRREDTHASTRRNTERHSGGGSPPDADPIQGFHTEE